MVRGLRGFQGRVFVCAVIALLLPAGAAFAGGLIPSCPSFSGVNLPIDNDQVLQWKQSTPNQFRDRAHVEGTISDVFPDRNGHSHFEIRIGNDPNDTLEVIYNQDFGSVPSPRVGDQVEACGDYITSTAQSGPYPASPDGAILHWVHVNPSHHGHPSGFLVINGDVCGQGGGANGQRWGR